MKENLSTLSALEIAEQMTFMDQRILFSISSQYAKLGNLLSAHAYFIIFSEFLGQAWNKTEKKDKAPNICLMTERFNDVR